MVTTDNKLAQAMAASEMQCVFLAEQNAFIAKDAGGDGYMVYGGEQQIRQPDPAAARGWLSEHGYVIDDHSDWLPAEVYFAGKRADTIVAVIEGELPADCYRFLLAQACAGEPVFAFLDMIGTTAHKYIWFINRRYTVAEFSEGWRTREIHP